MDQSKYIVSAFIAAYLCGSLPFGLIAGLWLRGIDIRRHGSGNIGATNVLRTLGYPLGITVMLLDAAKGALPAYIALQTIGPYAGLAAGIGALAGHNKSVWLRFKGGKGVATSLGVIAGLAPSVAGITALIWIIVLLLTRYVSLASIVAALTLPFIMLIMHSPRPVIIFGILAAVWVVVRHRENIMRLLAGKENRFGARVSTSGPDERK